MSTDPNSILLNEVSEKLSLIMKKLSIVPDLEMTITDFEASIASYETFALDELKLGHTTIDNQKSAIRNYLAFSNGIITKETVTQHLDSNESDSWRSNQLKALRRYTRDLLKLGNWTEDFHFKTNTKLNNTTFLLFFLLKPPANPAWGCEGSYVGLGCEGSYCGVAYHPT